MENKNTEITPITYLTTPSDFFPKTSKINVMSEKIRDQYIIELETMSMIQNFDVYNSFHADHILNRVGKLITDRIFKTRGIQLNNNGVIEKVKHFASKEAIFYFCRKFFQCFYNMFEYDVTFYGRYQGNFINKNNPMVSRLSFIIVTMTINNEPVRFLLDLGSIGPVKYMCQASEGQNLDTTEETREFTRHYAEILRSFDNGRECEFDSKERYYSSSTETYMKKNIDFFNDAKRSASKRTGKTETIPENIGIFDNLNSNIVRGSVVSTSEKIGCVFFGNAEKASLSVHDHHYQINFKTGEAVIFTSLEAVEKFFI